MVLWTCSVLTCLPGLERGERGASQGMLPQQYQPSSEGLVSAFCVFFAITHVVIPSSSVASAAGTYCASLWLVHGKKSMVVMITCMLV